MKCSSLAGIMRVYLAGPGEIFQKMMSTGRRSSAREWTLSFLYMFLICRIQRFSGDKYAAVNLLIAVPCTSSCRISFSLCVIPVCTIAIFLLLLLEKSSTGLQSFHSSGFRRMNGADRRENFSGLSFSVDNHWRHRRKNFSSSSKTVSMITRISGYCCLISHTACIPFMPGISISISTTSGFLPGILIGHHSWPICGSASIPHPVAG